MEAQRDIKQKSSVSWVAVLGFGLVLSLLLIETFGA